MRYCFLTNTYLTFKMTTNLKDYKLQLQNGKDINSQLNKYIFNACRNGCESRVSIFFNKVAKTGKSETSNENQHQHQTQLSQRLSYCMDN